MSLHNGGDYITAATALENRKAFQRWLAVKDDGIVGPATLAAFDTRMVNLCAVATTSDDIKGGFPGDEFVLQGNDANTTVQHNAGIQLNGGANKVLAAGETIRLRRVSSTAWKQI